MKKTDFDRYLEKQLKDYKVDLSLQMYTAYCPHCRTVTNLSESITLQINPGPDGKTEMFVSRTYHCESCCSFVRSEDETKSDK
jgi:hypothetical protein